MLVSKHDLKHFSKSDIFRFTGGVSMDFCPRRATKRHQYLLVYSITTKYDFYNHEIYDIETKILYETCFATKMLVLFCKSMIPVRFCTILPLHSCASIKTRFKTLFYAKLVSAITRRRSKLWWRTTHQSKALDEIYNLAVSKRDLKHFSKSDLPGFAGGAFNDSEVLFNDFEMCC